ASLVGYLPPLCFFCSTRLGLRRDGCQRLAWFFLYGRRSAGALTTPPQAPSLHAAMFCGHRRHPAQTPPVPRSCRRLACYSALMPAAAMVGAQRSCSSLRTARKSSDELAIGVTYCVASFSATSGSASTAAASSWILASSGWGVPAGAIRPTQASAS